MAIRLNNGGTTDTVRFDGSASPLRAAGETVPVTIAGWVRVRGGAGTRRNIFKLGGGFSNTALTGFRMRAETTNNFESINAGGASEVIAAITLDQWIYIALQPNGIFSGTVYQGTGTTLAVAHTGFTSPDAALGHFLLGAFATTNEDPAQVELAHVRCWQAALTEVELEAEMVSYTPVRTANLWLDWDFVADANDRSGNSRNGTVSGSTFSYVAGPLSPPDTTPDGFTFTDQTGVALATTTTSNTVTISGINTSTAVTVSGGEWQKNGGGWTSSAGTVVNGDTIAVRHTSAATSLTAVNTTLTVGGVSDTFTSTTGDAVPTAFSFADVTGLARSTVTESADITVAGINIASPISVTNGEYRKNGGAWVSSAGTVVSGDVIRVRNTSSNRSFATNVTTLNIGGVTGTFTSRTAVFGASTFRAASAASNDTSLQKYVDVPKPTGAVADDWLYALIIDGNNDSPGSYGAVTSPGWTVRGTANSAPLGYSKATFLRRRITADSLNGNNAAAEPSTYRFTTDYSGETYRLVGNIQAHDGIDLGTPNDATELLQYVSGGSLDITALGLTPSQAETYLLTFHAGGDGIVQGASTIAPPPSMVEAAEDFDNNNYYFIESAHETVRGTSATGTRTAVKSATATPYFTASVLLRAAGAGTTPGITSVTNSGQFQLGVAQTLTGTGFEASQGTGNVLISPTNSALDAAAVSQTETSWGDTSIPFTVVQGNNRFFATHYAFVTNNSGLTSTPGFPVQLVPAAGEQAVTLGVLDPDAPDRITATPDLVPGDQVHARGVGGGAAPAGLSLATDGTFFFTAGNTPSSFDVRVWDVSDGTWGAWATQSVPDVIAPSAPGTPTTSQLLFDRVTINYTAATDNVAVTGYESRVGTSGAFTDRGNVLSFVNTGLSGSTAYTVQVRAYDAAGNRGPTSQVSFTTPAASDTVNPSAPGAVTISAITATGATASWGAATDNIAVTGYETRVDTGAWVNRGNVLTAPIAGLNPRTTYSVQVRAYDAAGNRGASSSANVTTLDDVAPTAPGTPVISAITAVGCTVTYTAATDNIGVTGYESSIDGVNWTDRGNVLTFGQTGLGQATTYLMRVRAYDSSGNRGPVSTATFATPDVTAPSAPGTPTFSAVTQSTATASWAPATDNVAVAVYRVRLNGAIVQDTASLSLALTGLVAGATYNVTVSARDAAGNESAESAVGVLTMAGSVAAPTGVTASLITTSTATVSWTAPGGSPAAVDYIVRVNGADYPAQTATSLALSGLTPGTAYTVTVRGRDALGNSGTQSAVLVFNTLVPDTVPPTVPVGVTATGVTTSAFTLSWSASTDASGVAGYHIYRDGVRITTAPVTGTSSPRSNLNPGQSYVFTVSAVDILGNESAQSVPLTVTMLTTTPPTVTPPEVGRFGGGARRTVRPRRRP